MGFPDIYDSKIICAGQLFKSHVKLPSSCGKGGSTIEEHPFLRGVGAEALGFAAHCLPRLAGDARAVLQNNEGH